MCPTAKSIFFNKTLLSCYICFIVMDSKGHINRKAPLVADADKQREDSLHLLFHDIFLSYEKSLYKLALHLCKDADVARDIVHDVFLKLWEIRHQIQEIQSIESFLFVLTRNKIMDHLRKLSSDARLKQAIWESMQHIVLEEDRHMENKEFLDQLQRAVNQLPPQRKAVYLMRDEGYDYKQIADKLQISRHTVKNHVSSALKSLRKLLR